MGLFVAGLTFSAVALIGLQEAADPALSRAEDLLEIEKKIVGR